MVMRTPLSSFRCLEMSESASQTRFPSSPLIIRVPFFLLFGFNKGTQKEKGQKGTTGEPSKEAQAMAAALQSQVVPTCVALNSFACEKWAAWRQTEMVWCRQRTPANCSELHRRPCAPPKCSSKTDAVALLCRFTSLNLQLLEQNGLATHLGNRSLWESYRIKVIKSPLNPKP